MARLFAAFIRHAEYRQLADTPSAHQPFPINDEGIVQATQAADQILQFTAEQSWQIFPTVDSSHLLRAWQTTQVMNEQFVRQGVAGLMTECFAALAERSVGSCVANLSVRQIEAILQQDQRYTLPPRDWKSNSEYCLPFPGAESLLTAGKRVATHVNQRMEEIRHDCTADSIKLFVGHGAAFRHAAYHLGLLAFEDIARLSMYHVRPIYFEYLGEHRWRHVAGEWKRRSAEEQYTD